MVNRGLRRFIIGSMFSALIFIATFISVPVGSFGNVNFGDSIILICSLTMGYYGVIPSSIGASLCDILSGYFIYAPGTFVIKGIMSFSLVLGVKLFKRFKGVMIISMVIAECVMVIGYLLYELMIFGSGALVNVPFNIIQGALNILISIFLYRFIVREKTDL